MQTAAEWERENKKNQLIALSATKDVQDSILSVPSLASAIDIIDIRYWHYQANGTAYAPLGGQNLAPRQHARLLFPKKTSFDQVYRAVREYKDRFPSKVVIYSSDSYDTNGWAVLMAGGSLPVLPANVDAAFLRSAVAMSPDNNSKELYRLSDKKGNQIFYVSGQEYKLNLAGLTGRYSIKVVDPRSGKIAANMQEVNGGSETVVKSTNNTDLIIWVTKI